MGIIGVRYMHITFWQAGWGGGGVSSFTPPAKADMELGGFPGHRANITAALQATSDKLTLFIYLVQKGHLRQ